MPIRRYRAWRVLVAASCLPFCAATAAAATLRVSATEPDSYPTIQAALDAAAPGDEIVLLDARYAGSGNRNLEVPALGLVIRSADGDPAGCAIDLGGPDAKPGRGLTFLAGDGGDAVLAGVTVRGAVADRGAAVLCAGSSPRLRDCVFKKCRALERGGGVAVESGGRPDLERCIVTDCRAPVGGAIHVGPGSGADLRNCTLWDNRALDARGGALDVAFFGEVALEFCIVGSPQGQRRAVGIPGFWPGLPAVVDFRRCDVYGEVPARWSAQLAAHLPGGAPNPRGNLRADPMLRENLHLDYRSPCVPTTLRAALPAAARPERRDDRCRYIGARGLPPGMELVRPDGSCECANLQEAVDQVHLDDSAGRFIVLGEGEFRGPGNTDVVLPNNAGIQFYGLHGRHRTAIRGDGVVPFLRTEPGHHGKASLYRLTVSGCRRAVAFEQGLIHLSECDLVGNTAGGPGGAILIGPDFQYATLDVDHCRFIANEARGPQGSGGAISVAGTTYLHGCLFAGNTADVHGGAIHAAGSIQLTYDLFWGNSAEYYGGCLYMPDHELAGLFAIHCLFAFSRDGGSISKHASLNLIPPAMCIFCGNLDNCRDHDREASAAWLQIAEADDTGAGAGANRILPPAFCDPAAGDFSLRSGSPLELWLSDIGGWSWPEDADPWCEPCDLGTWWDWDGDGVYDSFQILDGEEVDCNGNMRLDVADIADGVSMDCDENGVPDECETD